MALSKTTPLTSWAPVLLACALGCATGTQGDTPLGGGQGGSADMGGTGGTADPSAGTAGTETTSAGTFSSGGNAGTEATAGTNSVAGTTSGGTFASAGTFSVAGTFSTGGNGGMANGGTAGTAGKGGGGAGGGGAGGGGAGGKGGSGGGGTGGTGGGGGGKCASAKLTPVSATDAGNYQYAPSQAIDGSMTTRWSSEHLVDTGYLQLDMGASVMINHVNIAWETAYATDYKLQVADAAAGPYVDLYENKAGAGGTEDILAPPIVPHAGRYFRMQGVTRKTQYGYSIYEIAIYGDTDPNCK